MEITKTKIKSIIKIYISPEELRIIAEKLENYELKKEMSFTYEFEDMQLKFYNELDS